MQEGTVRQGTPGKPGFGTEAALGAVAADILLYLVLASALSDPRGYLSYSGMWICYGARAVLAAVFAVVLARAFRRKARDFGLSAGSVRTGLLSCLTAVGAGAALLAAGGVLWLSLRSVVRLPEIQDCYDWSRGVPYAWLALSLLAAPAVEEFLYRGVLYSPLEDRLGRTWAIIASGFVFQALHLSYGIYMPHYFFGGMILAWSFAKGRSLLYPFLLHAGWNAFTVFIDYARWQQWLRI